MTNYYVKNGGNDSYNGLSDAQAWATIGKVNSTSFANDDVINLKRGSTFTDATLTIDATLFGRSGITVQDYGSGNKPWINGNSVVPILINHVLLDITLKNIDVSGTGVYGTRCTINRVNGLLIDGVDCDGHVGSGTYFRCNAINVTHVDGDIEIKNCHIQNLYRNTFLDSIRSWDKLDAHGILFWYPGDENVKLSGTINVHDNYIHDVYADCIQLAGVHTTTNIYDNTLGRFGENALDLKYSRHIEIYNNNIYHDDFGLHHGGGYYGCAVFASGGANHWSSTYKARDNIVRDNYIHDCKWQGIASIGTEGKIYGNYFKNIGTNSIFDRGTEIYNNIFESTIPIANEITYPGTIYEFDWSTRYNGIMASSLRLRNGFQAKNIHVYNNTFYISSSNHLYGIAVQADADCTGTVIKNNVIYMARDSAKVFPLRIYDYDDSSTLPTVQYNELYSVHSNRVKIEETPGNWTLYDSTEQAAWRTSGHKGGLFTNPEFVDPSSGDFTLQSSSPAINAGTYLGNEYKMALDPESSWPDDVKTIDQDSQGDGWEIGAFVYLLPYVPPPHVPPDESQWYDPIIDKWEYILLLIAAGITIDYILKQCYRTKH